MASSQAWFSELNSCLDQSELYLPDSATYKKESTTWAAQANLGPKVLTRPRSLDSLSRLLSYLHKSSLHFGIRGGGLGGGSAKDVLISLAEFDGFEFDPTQMTITVGTGQTWGEVDMKLGEKAPGHAGKSLVTHT
jgi:FAD/FMN-containing dehydrogenase